MGRHVGLGLGLMWMTVGDIDRFISFIRTMHLRDAQLQTT